MLESNLSADLGAGNRGGTCVCASLFVPYDPPRDRHQALNSSLLFSRCRGLLRRNLHDRSDRPDEPKQFADDGDHGLVLRLSTNQEMPTALVEPLLSIPGDRAGWCWNFALAFA